jgi:peptidoglycan/xylan/chitin deacetylase (PgdA/CDA1 family)
MNKDIRNKGEFIPSNLNPSASNAIASSKLKPPALNEAEPPTSNSKVALNEALLKPQTSDTVRASNLQPPASNAVKPLASISIDLDNLWSYMKTHGEPGWEQFPSYFDLLIPYLIDILDKFKLKITCFIVGQDAALEKNQDYLRFLVEKGHEAGNHSFHHEPWLHLFSKERVQKEVLETENQIYRVVGQRPVGFRGPGFSLCRDLLEILHENDYIYDCSTLPTYLGPIARKYYFWTANFTEKEKKQRKDSFGNLKDGLRPVKAYHWQLINGRRLLEIPVTTIPIIKTPFHLSYLIWLSRFSGLLMSFYLNIAIFLCKATGTEPSFLLHPTDIIGGDRAPELAFFPGMDLTSEQKALVFSKVIRKLSKHYKLVNMSTHAESYLSRKKLKVIELQG